jgi:hypothetical protein
MAPLIGDFLVQRYSVFGVIIQNWMVIAGMVIVVASIWAINDS